MRRSLFSSYFTKKNIAIVFVVILIIVGGYLLYSYLSTPQVSITPLRADIGHFSHPPDYWEEYYEYRMYANISLPEDAKGYQCVCSFYDKEDNEILNQSTISLDNYTLGNANKEPVGLVRWHVFHDISKVEISVLNGTNNLVSHTTYDWTTNSNMFFNITDSVYSKYF